MEIGKPEILFDMRKFQHTVSREMRKDQPDWGRVRQQAISSLVFGDDESSVLDQPVWLLMINIVALDLLRSRIESVRKVTLAAVDGSVDSTEERVTKEEDPYFSGLEAKVPPFVHQDSIDQDDHQVLGHPVSWHRKVGPSPPIRSCSK